MRELGVALNTAVGEAPGDTDADYLQAPSWPAVAVAGRLAQVIVANDLQELVALHNTEPSTGSRHKPKG